MKRPVPPAFSILTTVACLACLAWPAGGTPSAPPPGSNPPPDSSPAPAKPITFGATLANPGAAKAPAKRNPLAEKLERKLRTEYLKATAGIKGPTLKAENLLAILDDTNLVLLDIRQPGEQAVSMIPKAITTVEFAERFKKGIPKAKRIVVYCTIGFRSGKYAMELAGQGIRAENLEGGVLAWSHTGGPFEVRNQAGLATPTKRVHVFDKGWNFLHPDYQAVW